MVKGQSLRANQSPLGSPEFRIFNFSIKNLRIEKGIRFSKKWNIG